jgi:hypothetical protein
VEELRKGKLCPVEITDAEPVRRSLDVILPRRRPLSKSAKELVEVLRQATHVAKGTEPERKTPRKRR